MVDTDVSLWALDFNVSSSRESKWTGLSVDLAIPSHPIPVKRIGLKCCYLQRPERRTAHDRPYALVIKRFLFVFISSCGLGMELKTKLTSHLGLTMAWSRIDGWCLLGG